MEYAFARHNSQESNASTTSVTKTAVATAIVLTVSVNATLDSLVRIAERRLALIHVLEMANVIILSVSVMKIIVDLTVVLRNANRIAIIKAYVKMGNVFAYQDSEENHANIKAA